MTKVPARIFQTLIFFLQCVPILAYAQSNLDWETGLTSRSAREWADSIFEEAVTNRELDSAVVSIVKNGETLYEAGYGMADAVEQRAATATTPFRSGSVSKLFTTISILQLAEKGQLELDDDINHHLTRGKVDTAQGTTTIRHLLTHTAGFEEKFRNTLIYEPSSERASADYMNRHSHLQVRVPGETITYSNHGMGIAGLIIEDVSGETYGDYVAKNLFGPLDMENAAVEFPSKLPDDIAQEYELTESGSIRQRPLLYKQPFYLGSGGFFYSARDMSKFMKAVLSRSPELLNDRSWNQAFSIQATAGEEVSGGIGLGFWMYEISKLDDQNFRPTIMGHGGSTEGFNSQLFLFPEEQIGLFFSVLDSNAGITGSQFSTLNTAWDFVGKFRGYKIFEPFIDEAEADVQGFAGLFIPNRRAYSGGEVFLGNILNSLVLLQIDEVDGVLFRGDTELEQIGPRSFGHPLDNGRWTVVSFSDDLDTVWDREANSYTRVSEWNPIVFFVPLILVLTLISLSSIVPAIWPGQRERSPDLGLFLAAFLATATILTPLVALLVLGDHFRLESARYPVQSILGACTVMATVWAIWQAASHHRFVLSNSLSIQSIHRALVVISLCGLITCFVIFDVIRL